MKGKSKGALFCDPASGTGSAEVTFTPPASPKADYIKYARVHDVTCGPNNTGMIVYASGLYWIGGVNVEKDNLVPTRSGAGAWVGPNGEGAFGTMMPDGVTFKLALMTEPSGVALRKMDEALPTGEAPARVRLTIPGVGYIDGETQNLVFQPQTAGNLVAFDGSFKTSGPIKAYEIPPDKMNEVSEIALVYLFNGDKSNRAATAIALEGLTKIDTTVPTAMGPAGTYLFNGRLRPGVLPIAAEVQPAPGTLVKYAPDVTKCLAKPSIPLGWLAWAPECKTNSNAQMQAWSVDGRYRLTYSKAKTQPTILEEFDPQRPGQAINEWRATSFSAEKVPTPRGAAELWRGDELAYRGPFRGLKPEGEGACSVPGDEGKTEPCTYADGERADAVYLARLEQKKLDEAFAQREVEYEMSRRAAAEARARQAREEAERKRQLAAQREAERQANRQAKASGLLNAFLGASYGSMVAANTGGNSGLTSLLSTAMQQKTGGTSGGNALTAILGTATQQQLGGGSSTNALQGAYNSMLKQTLGTSAETLLNNPVQAALEMKQKADQDKAKREAAASTTASASIAPAMNGSAAMRPPQNTLPAPPPPPAQSNTPSANSSSITVIGANGTYQTADGTYRVEAKFEGGNLILVEPNKISKYAPEPSRQWGPGVFVFTNPVNNITYRMQVQDRYTLLAFKTDLRSATPLKLIAEAKADSKTPLTTAQGTGINTSTASAGSCSAKEVVVEGQKQYITQKIEGFNILGDYYFEGKADAHPMVRLSATPGQSFFELHGVERFPEFKQVMKQWGILANCDGTAMKKGYGAYILIFERADGTWDMNEFGVLADRGILTILGERIKSIN